MMNANEFLMMLVQPILKIIAIEKNEIISAPFRILRLDINVGFQYESDYTFEMMSIFGFLFMIFVASSIMNRSSTTGEQTTFMRFLIYKQLNLGQVIKFIIIRTSRVMM
jgi:hypothetical protein